MATKALDLGSILDALAHKSSRPRYAFMVLNLLCEQADDRGKVGPFVKLNGKDLALRDWVGARLSTMAENVGRRVDLAKRVRDELSDQLPADLLEAQEMVDRVVERRARESGADNFSRVLPDLEAAGFLKRHYEGRITNHANRGGRRNLVCTMSADALAALRRRDTLI
jgi:hypothetical protein